MNTDDRNRASRPCWRRLLLTACAAPDFKQPQIDTPAAFKGVASTVPAAKSPADGSALEAGAAGRAAAARRVVAGLQRPGADRADRRSHHATTPTWRSRPPASSRRGRLPVSPKRTASRRWAWASAPSARACRRAIGLPHGAPVTAATRATGQPDGQLRSRPVRPRGGRRVGGARAMRRRPKRLTARCCCPCRPTWRRPTSGCAPLDAELATLDRHGAAA